MYCIHMYVGMTWVCPWLIALEGEYIRSTLIWWYTCYYIRVDLMYVGVAWVHPWLEGEYTRLILIWWYACYYIRDGLCTLHKIDPCSIRICGS